MSEPLRWGVYLDPAAPNKEHVILHGPGGTRKVLEGAPSPNFWDSMQRATRLAEYLNCRVARATLEDASK